jgi:hypothetical protein
MKHDHHQQIAKFFTNMQIITAANGINHFPGFFENIFGQRFMSLLSVP